jgi:amino acid permease
MISSLTFSRRCLALYLFASIRSRKSIIYTTPSKKIMATKCVTFSRAQILFRFVLAIVHFCSIFDDNWTSIQVIYSFFLYRKKKKRSNTQRQEKWSMKIATTEKEKLEIFHDHKKKKKRQKIHK